MAEAIDRFDGEVTTCPPRTFSQDAGYKMTRAEYLAQMKRQMRGQSGAWAKGRERRRVEVAQLAARMRFRVVEMATSSTLTVTQIGEALGIRLCSRLKKWRAVAWHGGKYHALKYHATKEEAQAAVEAFRATVQP
jgi:hypothetical protein